MPKLKILGNYVMEEIFTYYIQHIIPEYDHPTELALEHLKITYRLEKLCQNSSLPNVRFLRIGMLNDFSAVQDIVNLDLEKLESLWLEECCASPSKMLIPRLGRFLRQLDLNITVGAINFLEIIDWCPNLENLDITACNENCVHEFSVYNYILNTPKHLKVMRVDLENKTGVQLRPGAIFRYFIQYFNMDF